MFNTQKRFDYGFIKKTKFNLSKQTMKGKKYLNWCFEKKVVISQKLDLKNISKGLKIYIRQL